MTDWGVYDPHKIVFLVLNSVFMYSESRTFDKVFMASEQTIKKKRQEPVGIAAVGIVFVLAGMSGIFVNTPELPGPLLLRALLTLITGCMIIGGILLLALPATRSDQHTMRRTDSENSSIV